MSGPRRGKFGEILTHSLSWTGTNKAHGELFSNDRLLMGQVEQVFPVDHVDNRTNLYTLYDVVVYRSNGATELIEKARMLQPSFGGGVNNFAETLQTDPGTDQKNFKKGSDLKRGHNVLIGFINGNKHAPVILGALPHNSPTAVKRRPKSGSGTFTSGEIQGLYYEIDNDGALKLTFNGQRDEQGQPKTRNGPTTINIDKSGNLLVSTNADQLITVDRAAGQVKIDNGSTHITMDQTLNKIQVQASVVEIGGGPLQPAVVGDDLVKILGELIDKIMSATYPTGVGPSGVAMNNPAFASIKARLEDFLSTKHKIEK